jgi:hypothetical protein
MIKIKFLIFLAVIAITSMPIYASDEASVSATVTPQLVSVKIADGYPTSVDYGVISLGSVNIDPIGTPVIRVENNGTVKENLGIKGENATVGSDSWVLSNTSGANTYVHKFAKGASPIPTDFVPLTATSTGNTLANNLLTGDTSDFKLRIDMPTTTGSYSQHTTNVVVVAVSS